MIINHNMASLNTYNKLSANNTQTSKALEKLSSGLRINKAGDDAAGLAISEKMRGQIRGLDQASRNAQDANSLLNTAEGNLSETQNILQRMKELATQAANDTNVGVDRGEIQKEINQLTSEINRIGNTTEFNTQKLLNGSGSIHLDAAGITAGTGNLQGGADAYKTESAVTQTVSSAALGGASLTYKLNGQTIKVNFVANDPNKVDNALSNVTATSANVNIAATSTNASTAAGAAAALQAMIDSNDALTGGYKVTAAGANITIEAVKGGRFDGAVATSTGTAGQILGATVGGGIAIGSTAVVAGTDVIAVAATTTLTMPTIDTGTIATEQANARDLVGKGITINGTVLEFYNSDNGAYTGKAQGIDISSAINSTGVGSVDNAIANAIVKQAKVDGVVLSVAANSRDITVTAAKGGKAGNEITAVDGGKDNKFSATFQIGANSNQSMTIDINDMRADALNVSGMTAAGSVTASNGKVATLTATKVATDGTNNTAVEYALDVSSHEKATAAISVIEDAIEKVSAERSKIGAYTNRLEHTVSNLSTSSENLTAAESRIRDVDMAKEMMNFQKNNILSQAAQAMLAQANQQPQGVLQLLR